MDSYGYSGAGAANFTRFGLDEAGVVSKVTNHVNSSNKSGRQRWKLLK
jgi:dihydroxyacetone synthase